MLQLLFSKLFPASFLRIRIPPVTQDINNNNPQITKRFHLIWLMVSDALHSDIHTTIYKWCILSTHLLYLCVSFLQCNYLIPALACMLILYLFQLPAYSSATNFPAVCCLFLLYGYVYYHVTYELRLLKITVQHLQIQSNM